MPETSELEFSDDVFPYDNKFPLPSELRRLSVAKAPLKLKAIFYKCQSGDQGAINAVGLEFENGIKSPLFETELSKDE